MKLPPNIHLFEVTADLQRSSSGPPATSEAGARLQINECLGAIQFHLKKPLVYCNFLLNWARLGGGKWR
jgi:hypothetical protein